MKAECYDFANPPIEKTEEFKFELPAGLDVEPAIIKAAEDTLTRLLGHTPPEGWAEEICKAIGAAQIR